MHALSQRGAAFQSPQTGRDTSQLHGPPSQMHTLSQRGAAFQSPQTGRDTSQLHGPPSQMHALSQRGPAFQSPPASLKQQPQGIHSVGAIPASQIAGSFPMHSGAPLGAPSHHVSSERISAHGAAGQKAPSQAALQSLLPGSTQRVPQQSPVLQPAHAITGPQALSSQQLPPLQLPGAMNSQQFTPSVGGSMHAFQMQAPKSAQIGASVPGTSSVHPPMSRLQSILQSRRGLQSPVRGAQMQHARTAYGPILSPLQSPHHSQLQSPREGSLLPQGPVQVSHSQPVGSHPPKQMSQMGLGMQIEHGLGQGQPMQRLETQKMQQLGAQVGVDGSPGPRRVFSSSPTRVPQAGAGRRLSGPLGAPNAATYSHASISPRPKLQPSQSSHRRLSGAYSGGQQLVDFTGSNMVPLTQMQAYGNVSSQKIATLSIPQAYLEAGSIHAMFGPHETSSIRNFASGSSLNPRLDVSNLNSINSNAPLSSSRFDHGRDSYRFLHRGLSHGPGQSKGGGSDDDRHGVFSETATTYPQDSPVKLSDPTSKMSFAKVVSKLTAIALKEYRINHFGDEEEEEEDEEEELEA
eukprot:Platyproteum_vivax@DN7586_c0_g1_i2.p1